MTMGSWHPRLDKLQQTRRQMLQPGTSPFADCLVTQLAKAGSLASLLSAGTSEVVGLRLRRGTGCAVQGHALVHACVAAWQGAAGGRDAQGGLGRLTETGFRDVDGLSDLAGPGAKGARSLNPILRSRRSYPLACCLSMAILTNK